MIRESSRLLSSVNLLILGESDANLQPNYAIMVSFGAFKD